MAIRPPPADHDLGAVLRRAHVALDDGETERGREFAQDVLGLARSLGDTRMEAAALACLAHCDRLASHLRRASQASRHAAHLYSALGDTAGEAAALTTLAHVSTFLGRGDEAIEAALLAVSLAQRVAPGLQLALALNYLGVAHGWSGSFVHAQSALDNAADCAAQCVPPASVLQPRTNQAWLEAIRLAQERSSLHPPRELQRLLHMQAAVHRLRRAGDSGALVQGLQATSSALTCLLDALVHGWLMQPVPAREALATASQWLAGAPGAGWLGAMHAWVAGEIAAAVGDPVLAHQLFQQVIDIASTVEHERLACLGHLLISQLHTQQGRHEQAAQELRRLRRREQQAQSESLEGRERSVHWQLVARQGQQDILKLEASSRQFERLSLEDPLTGIANRRCFERALPECLRQAADTAQPVSVALIDVDRFKHINDNHTHQVGDAVLKTLATILGAQVREGDMAARLAGDEFVVLLARNDLDAAQQVCARIREAVLEFPWATIAPGLAVTVTAGAAQCMPGDTVESVLYRSDVAMYAAKKAAQQPG